MEFLRDDNVLLKAQSSKLSKQLKADADSRSSVSKSSMSLCHKSTATQTQRKDLALTLPTVTLLNYPSIPMATTSLLMSVRFPGRKLIAEQQTEFKAL